MEYLYKLLDYRRDRIMDKVEDYNSCGYLVEGPRGYTINKIPNITFILYIN